MPKADRCNECGEFPDYCVCGSPDLSCEHCGSIDGCCLCDEYCPVCSQKWADCYCDELEELEDLEAD